MAGWVGGAFLNRDKKGDPNGRDPITPVPAVQQREALAFVLENTFRDEAFGLTPELLNKMTVDKWWDEGGMNDLFEDETWPVHDRILGIQGSVLTMLMNPTTLGRVFDNEFRVPGDQDMITVPEVVGAVSDEIWREIAAEPTRQYTARQPMISSLRRNLQREHLQRLIDLTQPDGLTGSARNAVSTIVVSKLRGLKDRLSEMTQKNGARLDPYTLAHLDESRLRIEKALDAQYIYNTDKFGGGSLMFLLGNQAQPASTPGQ
jgi:hypothetical protein